MTTEADFQRAVIDLAKRNGWHVTHTTPTQIRAGRYVTATSGHPGFVDLVLARRGVVIHAELKTGRGTLSHTQHAWAQAIGPTWRLWTDTDWPAIRQELAG